MVEVIIIDDDESFLRITSILYKGRVKFHLADPANPWNSGLELIRRYPSAFVFIDLSMGDEHGRVSTKTGIALAELLLSGIIPGVQRLQLRFLTNHLGNDELSRSDYDQINLLGIELIDKMDISKLVNNLLLLPLPDTGKILTTDPISLITQIDLYRRFSGQVVAYSGNRVWGSGHTDEEAYKDAIAQQNCPPPELLQYFLVPEIL